MGKRLDDRYGMGRQDGSQTKAGQSGGFVLLGQGLVSNPGKRARTDEIHSCDRAPPFILVLRRSNDLQALRDMDLHGSNADGEIDPRIRQPGQDDSFQSLVRASEDRHAHGTQDQRESEAQAFDSGQHPDA